MTEKLLENIIKKKCLIPVFCTEKKLFAEHMLKKLLSKKIKCNIVNTASVYPDLTPTENITFYKSINTKKQNFSELIKELLSEIPEKKIAKLDSLQQKTIQIACSLTNNPQVLICPEPTFGLKKEEGEIVRGYLRKIGEEAGVFLITSLLDELELAEKIWLVNNDFEIKEITQAEKMDFLSVSTTVLEVDTYA